jgi:hypothetical protein
MSLKYVYAEKMDNGHTNVIDFNFEGTCKVPEFEEYYRLRKSNPKVVAEKWHKKFGKDLCGHFELAFAHLEYEDELL